MAEIWDKERPVEEVFQHSPKHTIGTNHFNQSLAPVFHRSETLDQRGMESGYTAASPLRYQNPCGRVSSGNVLVVGVHPQVPRGEDLCSEFCERVLITYWVIRLMG